MPESGMPEPVVGLSRPLGGTSCSKFGELSVSNVDVPGLSHGIRRHQLILPRPGGARLEASATSDLRNVSSYPKQ